MLASTWTGNGKNTSGRNQRWTFISS